MEESANMSTGSSPSLPSSEPDKPSAVVWIGLAILAAIIVILVFVLPKGGQEPAPVGNTNPAGVPIPDEIFSYTGVITEKGENSLVLDAQARSNYLAGDVVMSVTVAPDTEIVRLVLPFGVPEGTEITPEEQIISLDDLLIGQEVTVYSDENIKGKTEFNTNKVEVVSFQ